MNAAQAPFTTLQFYAFLLLSGVFCFPVWAEETDLHQERHRAAIQTARALVAGQPAPPAGSLVGLADALLRGGQYDEAVTSFERAIERDPQSEPYLWQYGIALFFAGRYDEARSLFEKHRVVNPHDVENAAWHFVCVAKADSVSKAREILLPAPGDSRAPMKAVLQRLQGGDFEAIDAAVEKNRGTPSYASAEFYGNLYIGLIADAEGNAEVASEHLRKASQSELTHYMADVARVYANWIDTQH
ncbi:tetratricopeptide repeat protein [Allorhodopirellula solitaria]|uniref:Lipoprotein NlpI n=1 Tax=Allorhodopirellula solitaria TaxID=2527987 RepID=A0A5C5XY01_9BACT|nr:tetratricopeptide repeat protein [Allorhodopirellula solitaria]TWT67391.1 lipoprotein NlpI [Allorhodopirellula solitaria]